MAEAPEVSEAASELYEALEPAFTDGDEARGWTTLQLCAALVSAGIDQVHFYVVDREDGTPGWGIVMDPDRAPAEVLPWLAQFDGAVLTPQMTELQKRRAIKTPEGFKRGTLEAIRAVAERRLTGGKRVLLDERSDGELGVDKPYQLRIRTLLSETPDPALTEEELRAEQKPIGIVLTYLAINGQTWGDLQLDHATWADAKADYATWEEAVTDLP